MCLTAAAGVALTGCDGDDSSPAAKPEPAARLSEASGLVAKTPRAAVVARIGRPYVEQAPPKATPNVARCYRWRLEREDGGKPDPRTDLQLCFDRRDRLTGVMTAPRAG